MKKFLSAFTIVLSGALISAENPRAVPSVSAEIEVITLTTLSDGNQLQQRATQRFYRDVHGRTRLENGDMVTINDVVAHEVLLLNLAHHTVQRFATPRVSASSGTGAGKSEGNQTVNMRADDNRPPSGSSLGVRNINGFATEGKEVISTIPANSRLGNKRAIQRTTRVWQSVTLRLPLLVEIQDALHGQITMQYKNVQVGLLLDPILFQVPNGFTVISRPGILRPPASGQFQKP